MNDRNPASWTDLINTPVYTSDAKNLGDIEALNSNFVVVKKGIVKGHRYYIPFGKVNRWDGKVVWVDLNEFDAKKKYERDRSPDPHSYYFSAAPPEGESSVMEDFQINMPKSIPPEDEDRPFVTAQTPTVDRTVLNCDLCDAKFQSKEQLDSHILKNH